MDNNVKKILQQLDRLEADLKKCQRRLNRIGQMRTTVYFGVPTQAKDHFKGLYQDIDHMRWELGVDTLPPEG